MKCGVAWVVACGAMAMAMAIPILDVCLDWMYISSHHLKDR